jgi:spore coat protein A
MNRRQFLQAGAGAAALLGFWRRAYGFAQSPLGILKFDATLPGLGPGGSNNYGNYLPVLTPNTTKYRGTDFYELVVKEFKQTLHPSIGETRFWGYADAARPDCKYLGGVIVAKRNRPVKLRLRNELPNRHILPYDSTAIDPVMGAEVGGRVDRVAVHLHGGLVHWTSDGGPFAWYSNDANPGGFVHGSSFLNGAGKGVADYDYPNDQSARMLWYHDHAYGITRINAYAGIATAYLITDDAETDLVKLGVIPSAMIPLVIQDKAFWDGVSDPGYDLVAPTAQRGSLWYPHVYESQPLPDMTISPPACGTAGVSDRGGLRRHHAGEWRAVSACHGAAREVPVPDAECFAGPVLEPATIRRGQQPGRHHSCHNQRRSASPPTGPQRESQFGPQQRGGAEDHSDRDRGRLPAGPERP